MDKCLGLMAEALKVTACLQLLDFASFSAFAEGEFIEGEPRLPDA